MPVTCTFRLSAKPTVIKGIHRGQFRLHPTGPQGLSEECITLASPRRFAQFAADLRKQGATWPVPGSSLKAYGWVNVQ